MSSVFCRYCRDDYTQFNTYLTLLTLSFVVSLFRTIEALLIFLIKVFCVFSKSENLS